MPLTAPVIQTRSPLTAPASHPQAARLQHAGAAPAPMPLAAPVSQPVPVPQQVTQTKTHTGLSLAQLLRFNRSAPASPRTLRPSLSAPLLSPGANPAPLRSTSRGSSREGSVTGALLSPPTLPRGPSSSGSLQTQSSFQTQSSLQAQNPLGKRSYGNLQQQWPHRTGGSSGSLQQQISGGASTSGIEWEQQGGGAAVVASPFTRTATSAVGTQRRKGTSTARASPSSSCHSLTGRNLPWKLSGSLSASPSIPYDR